MPPTKMAMSKSDVIKQLRAAITGQVIDDPYTMGAYRHDQCLMAPAGDPLVVVHAQSSDDVIATFPDDRYQSRFRPLQSPQPRTRILK